MLHGIDHWKTVQMIQLHMKGLVIKRNYCGIYIDVSLKIIGGTFRKSQKGCILDPALTLADWVVRTK